MPADWLTCSSRACVVLQGDLGMNFRAWQRLGRHQSQQPRRVLCGFMDGFWHLHQGSERQPQAPAILNLTTELFDRMLKTNV